MLHPAAVPLIAAGIHAVDQHFGAVAAGAKLNEVIEASGFGSRSSYYTVKTRFRAER